VDDLLKDREEANSALIREKAMGWLSSVAFTRMHPGASFILIATRWHLDDPTGRLMDAGYEHINLPAINPDGEALWPERRPLPWLQEQRARMLPHDWSALYMGEPTAPGDRIFGPSTYYDGDPPADGYQEAHGFDAAYTTKTTSDYTVTLTGRGVPHPTDPTRTRIYLTGMLRHRIEPDRVIPLMREAGIRRVHWYASSTEKGLALLLQREGITANVLPTVTDKLARATPAAVAWARGDILIPRHAPWAPALESEVSQFTGIADAHDDIVDALAALHHALATAGGPYESRRAISRRSGRR
jgi:predicted phage terminase large subunit-like protein